MSKLYWDLEVYFDHNNFTSPYSNIIDNDIFMASIVINDKKLVLNQCKLHSDLCYVNNFKSEKELILKLFEYLNQVNYNYTYYGDIFDIPYLLKRANLYNINTNINSVSIDIFKYIINVYYWLISYKLDYIAKKYIQDTKVETTLDELMLSKHTSTIYEHEKILEYNLQDSILLKKLDDTLNITNNLINMSNNLNISIQELVSLDTDTLTKLYANIYNLSLSPKSYYLNFKCTKGIYNKVYVYDFSDILVYKTIYNKVNVKLFKNYNGDKSEYFKLMSKLRNLDTTIAILDFKLLSLKPINNTYCRQVDIYDHLILLTNFKYIAIQDNTIYLKGFNRIKCDFYIKIIKEVTNMKFKLTGNYLENITYKDYLSSKWWLMVIATTVSTLLASLYLFFGIETYLAFLTGAIFNIGVNSHLVLLGGAYIKTPIDLTSNKNAFGDKKAFNVKTLLISLPKLLLPMLVYAIGHYTLGWQFGYLLVALLGILGFAFKNKVFQIIESIYKKEKYITLEAYKQKG